MKIGIDARMYGPEATTGIGQYIKKLTDELLEIDKKNEYILFLKDPVFSEYEIKHPNVKKVKANVRWYSLAEQLILPFIYLRHRLDVLHVPHFNAPFLYPKKMIVTIHDVTPYFFPGPKVKKSIFRKLAYKLVIKMALVKAEKIIAVSSYTKNQLRQIFKIKDKKIIVIHLGYDKKVFKRINVKSHLKPYILYVGIWRDHKNIVGLVKAFDILKKKHNVSHQLVIAGPKTPTYLDANSAIDNSPYKSEIITPGYVSADELALLHQEADVFVLPSFCEGFGLVGLDSLSYGVPVVASKTTSLPEILQDAAIYFDPKDQNEIADKIYALITDVSLRIKLETNIPKVLNQYDWHYTATRTLEVYG